MASGAYVGRFAPSPSGELHLGSLYTAAASYLDARAAQGRWLVRMEDLDAPRVVAGADARILRTLERFGFEWDGAVLHQSTRTAAYSGVLAGLQAQGLCFECSCSRSELADEQAYPGTCRPGPQRPGVPTAIRLRVTPGMVQFTDRIQGTFRQDVAAAVGDFVLRRRDQWFAYVLAVIIDDAEQGVTHVVRGADLLDNTPRQIHLQELLGVARPHYAHVPLLIEPDGSKLSKTARSLGLVTEQPVPQLIRVFRLLGLAPPAELTDAAAAEAWRWAIGNWQIEAVPRRLSQPLTG